MRPSSSSALRSCETAAGGAARELSADDVAFGNCLEREVLAHGQRRPVPGEQTLHPAADERRGADECVCGQAACRDAARRALTRDGKALQPLS